MTQIMNPTVWNPKTNCLHVDDPYEKEPVYGSLLMDIDAFMSVMGGNSKAASTASLHEIFYNGDSDEVKMLDLANDYYDGIARSRAASTRFDRQAKAEELLGNKKFRPFENNLILAQHIAYANRHSKAGAIITSADFAAFQDVPSVGSNMENRIRTGILSGLFQSVALAVLSGKWRSESQDLKYYRNIAEGKSPEPSKGTGTVVTVTVQKHGGAVAITQRAQQVINEDNPFARLVTQMGQKRLFDENDMVADEIESNVTPTITGVDFGARTGSPPVSTTNPLDFLTSLITVFEALSLPVNLFVTRGFMYNEFILNDIMRGGTLAGTPPPTQTNVNEQVGPFPYLGGVTWARDNAITNTTSGWAMNDAAIKNFRGPSRNYTIADEDTETTKYVTKNHFMPETVDPSLIYKVNGIAAP
jgi:hypothetical protein